MLILLGEHMTDTSLHQDEELLEAGDEAPALESGDDLAQQALQASSQSALPAKTSANDPAALQETLTALQNIIERNVNELDRIKEELKVERDSLKNIFENDTKLSEAQEQVSTISQQVKERKSQIQASPEVMQYKTKIADLTEQKKEIEEALNNHLLNFYQVTGAKLIDTSDGKQREFNIRASIKGRKPQAE